MDKNYQVVFKDRCKPAIEEAEMPVVGDDQVLIKTLVTQISTGTELTMLEANVDADSDWNTADDAIAFPSYPGYCNVGLVIDAGKNVDRSVIGKRVYTSGAHVAYLAIDYDRCAIIPDTVSDEQAAVISMARVSCGNVRITDIRLGENVLVFGAGVIGQFTARFAKLSGALRVIVADISENRLGFVPKEPGFYTLNSMDKDFADNVLKICKGELPKYVFETTSNQKLIDMEMRYVADFGKLIITSSPKGKSTVDFDYINRHQINVVGGANWIIHPPVATGENPWTLKKDAEYFLDLSELGLIPTESLITHRYNWKDAPKAYEMLMEDRTKAMNVIIDWKE